MKRRRNQKGVPCWKYTTLTIFLILSLILNVAYISLSFDFMKSGKGEIFEKSDMRCFNHLKTHYCCERKYFDEILTTNLTSHRQINWTYYPDCYKIQINEVVK